ncbi:LysR substrate-binding domain-containing protein [Marinobacteraceae bacterium S3BR75-40.1]
MNYRKTPPIQLIPAFEAAARHLSFKKAAEELYVTAPAIGQKIKAFEEWLQASLFERHTRQVRLTAEGQFYFEVAQQVMHAHRQGYTAYRRQFDRSTLHISAPLFVAQELIMPNYLQFREQVADRELRVEARMSFADFDAEHIDAAIRFGDGNWPDLDCRKLCDTWVAPVCSPSYAASHRFTGLERLHEHRLIYAEPAMLEWEHHFRPQPSGASPERIVCDSYLAAMKAASDGLGVALALLPTASSWVKDKRLVLPFPIRAKIDKSYWLVTPKSHRPEPDIEALYSWLKGLFDNLPSLQ